MYALATLLRRDNGAKDKDEKATLTRNVCLMTLEAACQKYCYLLSSSATMCFEISVHPISHYLKPYYKSHCGNRQCQTVNITFEN